MTDLCSRLQDVTEAGVYVLNCPLTMLEANVALSGLNLLECDLLDVTGKGALLAKLAQVLKAPDWFGHNWDALADVMTDLAWLPAEGYVLLLRNGGERLGLSEADFEIVSGVFSETVQYWKSQNKPFWVLLSNDL
ncbi:MAG: barstar family protein [Gallionellaceae bacterium]|nr:barstar family protein [Gallionellaceae bacterium]